MTRTTMYTVMQYLWYLMGIGMFAANYLVENYTATPTEILLPFAFGEIFSLYKKVDKPKEEKK